MRIAPTRWIALLLLTSIGAAPIAAFAAEPDGSALFQANCAKCHGPDGKANTPVSKAMKAPSLMDSTIVTKGDTRMLVERIGAIDKHKPITSKLSPEELNAIAKHVHEMGGKKPKS